MSGHASVTLRVREDMGQIPLEVPLNESVREIAVSFDPNSRGVDLTLASGAEVSVSVPTRGGVSVPNWIDTASKLTVDGRTVRFGTRRTGRTTRMLNQALQWAAFGQEVLVIAAYANEVPLLQEQLRGLSVQTAITSRVTVKSLGWALKGVRDFLRGRQLNSVVVALDHCCEEVEPVNTDNVRRQIAMAECGARIIGGAS